MNRFVPAILSLPVSARDHRRGDQNAAITLVEYGDFECPSCGAASSVIGQLQQIMTAKMNFVFRHFPLSELHAHAQRAAEAAEAAGAQGQFWEMHDLLFENQQVLDNGSIIEYAARLEIDVDQFLRDLTGHKFARKVREDFESAIASGVSGTPTFFINGKRHDAAWDLNVLINAVEQSI